MSTEVQGIKYEIDTESSSTARIKVLGIGGGGCNAAAAAYRKSPENVEYYALDTDLRHLESCAVPNKIPLGNRITSGFGTGGDPEQGKEAAVDSTEAIMEALESADLVFLCTCLGGGTGTGATPTIASLARGAHALTIAIVFKPFSFEGPRRLEIAEASLQNLRECVDTLIVVSNDRLLELASEDMSIFDAFAMANEVLTQAVTGIRDILLLPGVIHRDLADLRRILSGMGDAMLGTGIAEGAKAAVEAAKQAIHAPLLERQTLQGASALLVQICGAGKLKLHDVNEACRIIREATGRSDAQLSLGVALDERLGEKVKVTIIGTGYHIQEAHQQHLGEMLPSTASQLPAADVIGSPRAVTDTMTRPQLSEQPSAQPHVISRVQEEPAAPTPAGHLDETSDLEIPAFLRRRRLLNPSDQK